jgi:transcriptional regulator with XRE-family HTH domain
MVTNGKAKSLQEYREARYLTVREFSDLLDVSVDTLYRIERGDRPRLSTMRRIAERLGVHPSEISEFVLPKGS